MRRQGVQEEVAVGVSFALILYLLSWFGFGSTQILTADD